jgi:DNA-binding response OmpR family regulator
MEQKEILVVDDDFAILDAIGAVLEHEGYVAHLLPYGEQIFESIADYQPDLIILDVMLGAVDGSRLCHLIDTTESLHDIPIIMISAKPDARELLKHRCPESDFIEKPFEMDTLLKIVKLRLSVN